MGFYSSRVWITVLMQSSDRHMHSFADLKTVINLIVSKAQSASVRNFNFNLNK